MWMDWFLAAPVRHILEYLVNHFPSQKDYKLYEPITYQCLLFFFRVIVSEIVAQKYHSDNFRWLDLNRLNRNAYYFWNRQTRKVWWQKKLLFRVAHAFYWCNNITILQLSIWPYTIETESARQVRKQYISTHETYSRLWNRRSPWNIWQKHYT